MTLIPEFPEEAHLSGFKYFFANQEMAKINPMTSPRAAAVLNKIIQLLVSASKTAFLSRQFVESILGRNDVRQSHGEFVVENDDLTSSDQLFIHKNFQRLTHQFSELND